MAENPSKKSGGFLAPLFLFVAATLIPELLIGSTPLSRLNQLTFQFPYYGSAALVIREAVIRLRLGRAGLLVLGLAFGVVTEGLLLQSIFNPHFLNLDISFGRAADVNWPWALYMVGYHALWSVTVPITLAGLVFRERQSDPWLGKIALVIFTVLFALMAFAFHAVFVKMSNFRAPTAAYSIAAAVAVLLVALGTRLKHREVSASGRPTPEFLPGILMLLSGLGWLLLYGDLFHAPHIAPAIGNIFAGLVLAAAFSGMLSRWAPGDASNLRQFWLVAGALAANTLFGFVVVSSSKLDTEGQIGLVVLVATGLLLLWRRLRLAPAASIPDR